MLGITAENRIVEALKRRHLRLKRFILVEGDQIRVYREGTGMFKGCFQFTRTINERLYMWKCQMQLVGQR